MPAIVVMPPTRRFKSDAHKGQSIFLAGSIEMGVAEDWQSEVIGVLANAYGIIYNPRRLDWDSSWKQEIGDPNFNTQVHWELDMIERADHVLFYFDPNTSSPITLMELGLCKGRGEKITVCCPEGFWRKGNVDIVCEREGFNTYPSKVAMMSVFRNWYNY